MLQLQKEEKKGHKQQQKKCERKYIISFQLDQHVQAASLLIHTMLLFWIAYHHHSYTMWVCECWCERVLLAYGAAITIHGNIHEWEWLRGLLQQLVSINGRL